MLVKVNFLWLCSDQRREQITNLSTVVQTWRLSAHLFTTLNTIMCVGKEKDAAKLTTKSVRHPDTDGDMWCRQTSHAVLAAPCSTQTADPCHSHTNSSHYPPSNQVVLKSHGCVSFPQLLLHLSDRFWGGKKNHCHKYHTNKEKMIPSWRGTKTEAENMMEDRINRVSEMCGGCCVWVYDKCRR